MNCGSRGVSCCGGSEGSELPESSSPALLLDDVDLFWVRGARQNADRDALAWALTLYLCGVALAMQRVLLGMFLLIFVTEFVSILITLGFSGLRISGASPFNFALLDKKK